MQPSGPVAEQKTQLRRRWKARLAAGFTRDAAANEALCRRIADDPVFRAARRIALFFPRVWEVDPLPLWRLRPADAFFPRVVPGTRTMEFYSVASLDALVPGFGAIPEPPPDPRRRAVDWDARDLILVPGVYYDRHGHRLGSGLGFYDRFLVAAPDTPAWGVCWQEQWLAGERILTLPHDVAVSKVVTEGGVHPVASLDDK